MKRKEKQKEFQRMSDDILKESLKEKKNHLMQLRFDLTAGKVKNVREIRSTRRDIARINTILCLKKS